MEEDNPTTALEVKEDGNDQKAAMNIDPTKGTKQASNEDGGRDVRIAVRRNRIEAARLARAKPKDDENEEKGTGKAKTQIQLSKKKLQSNWEHGADLVSNIKAAVTARESIRRNEEKHKVRIWQERESEEKQASTSVKDQIDQEWKKVTNCKGPYDLLKLLEDQKQACINMLKVKDALAEEYILELKAKDDEYVRELKRQSEEIDKLLDKMDSQFKSYQIALLEEIEQVEKAFVEERTELVQSNSREMEKCFTNRRNNEISYMDEKALRMDEYINQLEQLRVSDAEEYNLVKVKLETDVQVLEQQLQQMRVTYLLNIEKLEYNYQVLKKREEENGTILGSQKRKINRLADHLNMLRIKSAKQEKSYAQENQSLTDDYKHLTEQYKELQKKFRHFQLADSKRFKEIWKMNEDEAKEIMRKVLQADRIIHEQQLGLEWNPPMDDLFKNIDPLFFHKQGNINADLQEAQDRYEHSLGSKNGAKGQEEFKDSLAATFQDHKKYSKTMKAALELLCNEAGFLVEDKLQKLLEPLHKDEQSLMRLDSIFKALAIETVEDIERLTSFFVREESITEENLSKSRSQLIIEDKAQLIHPNEVVGAIRKFVEETRQGSNIIIPDKPEVEKQESINELNNMSAQEKKQQMNEQQYWERMKNVLDESKFRTWNAVYAAMEKYHAELIARYNLCNENKRLKEQNDELKNLLRQYMAARVNDELQIPPSQIMLAQAGMLTE